MDASLAEAIARIQAARQSLIDQLSSARPEIEGVRQTGPRSAIVNSSQLSKHGWSARTYLVEAQLDDIIDAMRDGKLQRLQEIVAYANAGSGTSPHGGTHILVARAAAPYIRDYLALHAAVKEAIRPERPHSRPG